jgi:hypothetical protein
VADEGKSRELVQHLGTGRAHPGAEAGGEHHGAEGA